MHDPISNNIILTAREHVFSCWRIRCKRIQNFAFSFFLTFSLRKFSIFLFQFTPNNDPFFIDNIYGCIKLPAKKSEKKPILDRIEMRNNVKSEKFKNKLTHQQNHCRQIPFSVDSFRVESFVPLLSLFRVFSRQNNAPLRCKVIPIIFYYCRHSIIYCRAMKTFILMVISKFAANFVCYFVRGYF